MPTLTITSIENEITQFVSDHGLDIRRGKVQRLANRLKCRQHSDVVPCEALHHILGTTPCRRCGQAPRELTV